MKNLLIAFCLVTTLSCGRANVLDPVSNNCEKISEEYLATVEVWSQDPTSKTKCEAVKKSLEKVLKSCSAYSVVQRQYYEEQLKEFVCE